MGTIIIKNAHIVNEGEIRNGDILIKDQRIDKIDNQIDSNAEKVIDAGGKILFPGVIDDQVHFREPGLTHKAEIYTESMAAVAGGTTSYMEMPNVIPPSLSRELLEDKYLIASRKSLANYSFYMGTSNNNTDEVLRTNPENVCGIKIFMGSSTGNMLVNDEKTLEKVFSQAPTLIATHCEDEATIQQNLQQALQKYGEAIPVKMHPEIRSREACYLSSSFAAALAKKHGTRLHILHISTADEIVLFDNQLPLEQKTITSEACIHHLWFTDADYAKKDTLIKWNPAVKSIQDREAIWEALLNDKIDVVATDHAPHTLEEKQEVYTHAPSGGPLVQHSLVAMLEIHRQGKITLEKIVEKMSHNPAILFRIKERGFVREGYFADLVLVDMNRPWQVEKKNILYKCGWSPFEGQEFQSMVTHTIVSGHLAYEEGIFNEEKKGERLLFQPK
ncbi:MAG: dihydroorotase [Cyclobacteriaceae bacterium]